MLCPKNGQFDDCDDMISKLLPVYSESLTTTAITVLPSYKNSKSYKYRRQ